MTRIRQTVFYLFILFYLFISLFVVAAFCERPGGSPTSTIVIKDGSFADDTFIENATVYINDISKNDYTVVYEPLIGGFFNFGVYLIYRLGNGTYTISVSAPGFVTQTRTVEITELKPHEFILTPGESIKKFLLSVEGIENGTIRSEKPGIDCGEDCYELFDENTTIRLFPTPDDGYKFDGWSDACAGDNVCNISIIQDETISAYFRKDKVMLIQPENIDFGNIFPGDHSTPKAITITNVSNSPLIFHQIELTANHSSDFTILNSSCQDNIIQPMNSCIIETRFSPSFVGPQKTNINIVVEDINHTNIQFPLTGYGFQTIFSYERIWPVHHNLHYFDKLTSIAVDPVKDHIYLVDSRKNQVLKYTSGGRYITAWGKYGNKEEEFDYPIGIAASNDGYVYVVDGRNYRIQKFSNFGKFITSWGNQGDSDGEFNWHPEKHAGIVIDSEGFVYISDNINDKVQKFSDSGDFVFSFTSSKGINDIAIDSEDNIYVFGLNDNLVKKYSKSGSFINTWGEVGSDEFAIPLGFSIANDTVYILDTPQGSSMTNMILKNYSLSGNHLKSYLFDFGIGEGEVFYDVINDSYIGITVDSNGMVYEVESGLFSRVQRFSPECEFFDQWSSQSTTEEAFQTPLEIIADQNNNIYVVDIFNYSVKKFSSNGLFDSSIFQKPTEADKFWPQGIAFDSENNLFVLDGNNTVLEQREFDSNEVINSFTIREEKTSCAGIVFDNHGYLYISNVTEHQIEKYDPSGEFIEFLGEHGNSPGKFSFPQGLAFDSNNHLYVVDQNNNRIQKLTSDGEYILHWGTKGDHPGEFNNPRGIAIDKDDNIYIADSYNHRVQLFSPNGRFLTSIGEYGVAPNMFRNPYYLCITDDFKLYVSDQNSRIQVFQKQSINKSRKAIIAVGREERNDSLWEESLLCVNYAYQTLLHQGYSANTIYYLSADSENNSDNDMNKIPDVDDELTIQTLSYAITQWAKDSSSLFFYFVDHGDDKKLLLKENVILEAEKLDEWLDTYQMNNGMLTVVLDACHSGSFLTPLNAQGGQKRIVISSAKAEENARLYNDGILSFSNHFFRYIFNSENVYSAFDKAAAIIKKMPYSQTPQLDDNENGSLAKITFIGNDLVQSISKGPEILSISEPQTISLATSATIKTLIRSNKMISSVIASIYPPETIFSEDSIKIPSFELIKVSDQPDDSNAAIYTGNYNSFNVQGVYHLSIYATDRDNFTSMPKTTSVVVKNAISNRVIILGSFYDNEWSVTEKNISLAYNTLLSQLYSDNNIDLLSPHAIENIEYAPLSPSIESLINVFENIPVEKTKDIILYLTGKGKKNEFVLNENETITPDQLKQLIDNVQSKISGRVIFIYDADYSGSFSGLINSDYKRVAICSTDEMHMNKKIYNVSFSNYFWTEIFKGSSLGKIKSDLSSSFMAIYKQYPVFEENNIENLHKIHIGHGGPAGSPVSILSVIPEKTLNGVSYAEIWAIISESSLSALEQVWAEILFESKKLKSNDKELENVHCIKLNKSENGKYWAFYTGFNKTGTYKITISAKNKTGLISEPSVTTYIQNKSIPDNDERLDLKDIIYQLNKLANIDDESVNNITLNGIILLLQIISDQY